MIGICQAKGDLNDYLAIIFAALPVKRRTDLEMRLDNMENADAVRREQTDL